MTTDGQAELARLLAGLRKDCRQQSGLAQRLTPPDIETGYFVAGLAAAELGWAVGGWKIAAFKPEMQRALRTNAPIYGRVFANCIHSSPHTVEHARQCSPIPEVEFQARLGADLPPRDALYTMEEIDAAVASLHPGLELAECRFAHDDKFPPLPAILADNAGSGTLVVGPAIENWRDRNVADQEVVLLSDGEPRRRGSAVEALDHPLLPVVWLANELSRKGIGLKAGQIVSTGTLTGMLAPKAGETFVADFGPLGSVEATYR